MEIDNSTLVAMITIGIPAILAPIVVAVVQTKQKRLDAEIAAEQRKTDRQEEWARADLLEERAVERAAVLAKHAEETAKLLMNAHAETRATIGAIKAEVSDVHSLVNSSYTAALQAALEAIQAKLVVLFDRIAFNKEHNLPIAPEITADLEATKKKMNQLSAAITERMRLDALAQDEKAQRILVGKKEPAPLPAPELPLPVKDDRTAVATERSAAVAVEKTAKATDKNWR